ncbi:MAG: LON peptidase substrate-binding domain-containing protein [Proteobacteria bacterium]|nr:LON peptidase substrate-binding domain-containing protein [Pseudomonadota bacterium]MCH8095969.1 LON peptidase substrate-binding domain-containing protein [Pseudomonadota bacterium]
MAKGPFDPSLKGLPGDKLPAVLPVFPLAGVLLLPKGKLPLNIFEPRYLNMIRDALGAERMIGMIQPSGESGAGKGPALYRCGCAGRITVFAETDDGRFLITLTGVIRFDVREELPPHNGYRRVIADYGRWRRDLEEEPGSEIDRDRLLALFRRYAGSSGIGVAWKTVGEMPAPKLVTALAMTCAFDPGEKQALLEAPDLAGRTDVLSTLLEMASPGPRDGGEAVRH